MDPKKKRIYVIVIVVCMLGTVGILYFGLKSPEVEIPVHQVVIPGQVTTDPVQGATPIAGGNAQTGYTPPAVFPASELFNTQVLESPEFKLLKPYAAVQAGETGRDDPFKNF